MEEARDKAMEAFQHRNKTYVAHTDRVLRHLAEARAVGRKLPLEMDDAFDRGMWEVLRNRWFCPEECLGPEPLWRSDDNPWENYVPTAAKDEWRVEDSEIWKPRVAPFVDPSTPNKPKKPWSQSKTFVDTEAHLLKCLKTDWDLACEKGAAKLIDRADQSGAPAPLDACFEVLKEHLPFVYSCFDYYAHLGSSDDVVTMHLNAYKTLIGAPRMRSSFE